MRDKDSDSFTKSMQKEAKLSKEELVLCNKVNNHKMRTTSKLYPLKVPSTNYCGSALEKISKDFF